jgi:hypothetical protein
LTNIETMKLAREADIDWHKHWDDESNRLEVFAALVAAAEREACAKVCEPFYNHEAQDCAEAIRARGQA